MFIPYLGNSHLFDWDEINFAESAREMLVSGNFLTVTIDYEPFWEKPPLFIWFQALSMAVFGVSEFAARLPNAICGILTLLIVFEIGRKLYSTRFGFFWGLIYTASFLPFFFFKSGIIDPWFNLFIFLSIYYLVKYIDIPKILPAILSASFAGLAVLTKGPAAVVIIALSFLVYLIFVRFKIKFKFIHIPLYILVFTFVGGFWFLLQILNGNYQLMVDFIQYQIRLLTTEDAGHGGPFFYHFIVLFFGVAPASILAISSFRRSSKYETNQQKLIHIWMIILFWVVLIIFSLVKTKIVHYSSLCYFPLTFLAARSLFLYDFRRMEFQLWKKILMGINFFFLSIPVAILPFFHRFKDRIIESGIIKDKFAAGNLMADVDWPMWITYFSITSFIALIIILFRSKWHLDAFKIVAICFIYISFNFFTIITVVPRIEQYSQNAAIEFFKKLEDKDVYVFPLGHKSYAHLFYSKKPLFEERINWNQNLFMTGNSNKDVYVIMRNDRANKYIEHYPLLEILYEKNGFVFGLVKKIK